MKTRRIFSASRARIFFKFMCDWSRVDSLRHEFSQRIFTIMNISRSIGRRKLLCRRFTRQWIEIECCLGNIYFSLIITTFYLWQAVFAAVWNVRQGRDGSRGAPAPLKLGFKPKSSSPVAAGPESLKFEPSTSKIGLKVQLNTGLERPRAPLAWIARES